jgi:hypothetical protein
VRGAIVPKVEIAIKGGTDDSMESIHMKTNLFREHREAKVIVAQEFDMKIQSMSPPNKIEEQERWILLLNERESTGGNEKEEGAIEVGGWVVN